MWDNCSVFLGIDLSSRDVATVLADENGAALLALRAARPLQGGSPAVWHAVVQTARETLMRGAQQPAQIRRVALAIDAPLDTDGVVLRGINTDGWEGFDVPRALREHLGIADTRAENRVVCEALGEARFGALRPDGEHSTNEYSGCDWLFVHVGEHLGAAARVNGHVLRGDARAALDIGAICIERDGELASSGRRGSLEAYCGGDNFVTRAASYGLTLKSAHEIWEMESSNFAARSLCDDYVRRLAQGLGCALSILNPRRVVLGGAIALSLGETLLAPLRSGIREFCAPSHSSSVQIVLSQLGQDAAVLGAVALALEHDVRHEANLGTG
ncbi:MAG TPA: ROK family protein [Abditibacteriaceae bacterium]|jgi:predicted NBD/HSP70 family sugar kinase